MLPLALLLACTDAPIKEADDTALIEVTDDSADDDSAADDSAADSGQAPIEVSWLEGCNPLGLTDDCLLPFPSMQQFQEDSASPTGLRMNLDNDGFVSPDGPLPLDLSIFNGADGVSPASTLLMSFGVDIHPDHLSGWGAQEATVQPGAPIALIRLSTGESVPILTEMDQANRADSDYDARHPLMIRPLAPMALGERYAVLLTDALTDSAGQPMPRSQVFDALRDGAITTSPEVEAMRPGYEQLLTTAAQAGWPRDQLLLAWELPVVSEQFARGPLLSMREQTLARTAEGLSYTITSVDEDPNENVAWLVRGTFTPPSFLNERNELALDDQHQAIEQTDPPSYPFTMTLPPAARDQDNLPLVLIGHGLFGEGDGMLAGRSGRDILQPLAARIGVVLVATDWIGLSGGDLQLIATEVLPDLGRVRLVTDRLVQAQVNNMALVEMAATGLADDPAIPRRDRGPAVDPERVYYYGISLGGIEGSTQLAISPRISRGVVAVPGAGWSNMIQRSTQFTPLEAIIDANYPDPLSQALFITAIQSFFDRADPAVWAPLIHLEDPGWGPEKVVVIQEAIGDCQVPNLATDLLSRAMGAHHLEASTDPVYGLSTEPAPTRGPALTQVRVPELLDAYFPPDENTLPERDNGVHNAAVLQDATFLQIERLLNTGELIHPCDGPCDPQ